MRCATGETGFQTPTPGRFHGDLNEKQLRFVDQKPAEKITSPVLGYEPEIFSECALNYRPKIDKKTSTNVVFRPIWPKISATTLPLNRQKPCFFHIFGQISANYGGKRGCFFGKPFGPIVHAKKFLGCFGHFSAFLSIFGQSTTFSANFAYFGSKMRFLAKFKSKYLHEYLPPEKD